MIIIFLMIRINLNFLFGYGYNIYSTDNRKNRSNHFPRDYKENNNLLIYIYITQLKTIMFHCAY